MFYHTRGDENYPTSAELKMAHLHGVVESRTDYRYTFCNTMFDYFKTRKLICIVDSTQEMMTNLFNNQPNSRWLSLVLKIVSLVLNKWPRSLCESSTDMQKTIPLERLCLISMYKLHNSKIQT